MASTSAPTPTEAGVVEGAVARPGGMEQGGSVMSTSARLKDGTEVVIRPLQADDLDRSFAFFQALPPEDLTFLRRDVTKRDVVAHRIKETDWGRLKCLVAMVGDEIVADGSLEASEHSWKRHQGELRLIVGKKYQRKGLGVLMARELYGLAAAEKMEEIVVRMMRPQKAARAIFRRLGFHDEIILPDYVKDRDGKLQDLVVMRCDLRALWDELEEYLRDSDWQRTR